MKKIYKYKLEVECKQELNLPFGYKILCVQVISNVPYLYAEVDPENSVDKPCIIKTYSTGFDTFDNGHNRNTYIGTYQVVFKGYLQVYHVYHYYDGIFGL